MYNKRFILLAALLSLPSCVPKVIIDYPAHEASGKKHLFTRKQQILFLGFFGKQRQRYESAKYAGELASWLAKRPLYKDISNQDIERTAEPSRKTLLTLAEKHGAKRILAFRTEPALQAVLYTFGKQEKHNNAFRLTSIPILPEPDDLLLTLASLDVLIQPAAQILSVEADGSLIVLPRTAPLVQLTNFLILSSQYYEQGEFVAKARVVSALSSTVLKIQDTRKDNILHKRLWAFPMLNVEPYKEICDKHRDALDRSTMAHLPGLFEKHGFKNWDPMPWDRTPPGKKVKQGYDSTGNEDK